MALGSLVLQLPGQHAPMDLEELPSWIREYTDSLMLPLLELYTTPLLTDSTLLVDLRSDADDRLADICGILEEYEALRTSRLQLQPPPGSSDPVRFRQCRVF